MKMASMATLLEARRIPVLYIYSEDDQLVDSSASVEYGELFGVTARSTKRYTENGQQTNSVDVNTGEIHFHLQYFHLSLVVYFSILVHQKISPIVIFD